MPILNWPLQSESHRQPRQPETVEDCNDRQMPYTTSGPFRTQTSLDVRCFGRALNPTRRVSERKTRSNKVRSLSPHEKMAQPRSPKYPGSLLRGKTFEGERPPSLMERLFSIVAPPLGRDRLPYAPRSSPAPLQLDRVRTSEMYRQPISSAPLSRCDRSVREKVAVRPLVTSVRVIYVRRVRVIRVTAPSGP